MLYDETKQAGWMCIIYRSLSVYATKRRKKRDDCVTYLVLLALMKRNKHVKSVIYFVLKDLMKRNKRD